MLNELLETGALYDIELYRNCFVASFQVLNTSKIYTFKWFTDDGLIDIDERDKLLKFINNRVLAGYNNWNYDDAVLNHLIANPDTSLHDLWVYGCQLISGKRRNDYRWKPNNKLYYTYDLLEVIREGFSTKSLKGVGVNLKHNKIQDLPINYEELVTENQLKELIYYNHNDLAITYKVFQHILPRLEMRDLLTKEYEVDVNSLADSGIAKAILNSLYVKEARKTDKSFSYKQLKQLRTPRDEIKLVNIIYDYVEFQTPQLQQYLAHLKTLTITKLTETNSKVKYTCNIPALEYGGNTYTIALGGIHSEDEELIVGDFDNSNDEEDTPLAPLVLNNKEKMLLDMDVASQYPSAILNNKLYPQHLKSDVFLPLLQKIVDDRLHYKRRKNENKLFKALEAGLKITINSIYGLLNSKTYWLFDPKVTFQVTVNNQLLILMLIEQLVENGIDVISANTDGIILHFPRDRYDEVKNICNKWEQMSGFTLEDTEYDLYVRRDVNNYVTRKLDGDIKCKGIFVPQAGILKGYKFPIVAIALQQYYLNKIPPEITIRNHKDIYDFCKSQKVGGQFTNVEQEVVVASVTHSSKTAKEYVKPKEDSRLIKERELQKTLRYYITNPVTICDVQVGKQLKKYKYNNTGEVSYTTYEVGQFTELFNDYVEKVDYNLNYQFYIDQCYKEIDKIGRII